MKICEHCGDEFSENGPVVVAAGGWCAPTEQLYEPYAKPVTCDDCFARWQMIAMLGIDPGRNGENLHISLEGIRYVEPE